MSVVVPSFNTANYLGETIESVLSQSYPNVELIVVDDGSTDESPEVIRRYGDRIKSVLQSNQGVAAARNRGISMSSGEFIAFLDCDDVWHADKLARQMPLMRDPTVGMVYSGLQYIDGSGQPLGTMLTGKRGHVLRDMAMLENVGVPACGSSALVRRKCLDEVGLFDTEMSYSADWDLWRRIACRYKIEIVPEPLVRYRIRRGSMTRDVAGLERDMLRAFGRMFADPSAREIWPLQRRCYGNLYRTLSGSWLRVGNRIKSLQYAIRSVFMWPPTLAYIARFPLRRRRRHGDTNQSDLRLVVEAAGNSFGNA